MANDCIFCQMASGAIAVPKLYEDDAVFVIKDIHPKAKVHLLAIPKFHAATLNDLPAEQRAIMANIATAITTVTAEQGIAESGYKVIINNGEDGGQAVPHLHCHILGGERVKGVT